MGERELESGLEELLDVRPPDVILLLNLGNTEDLNIPESGTVSGSHVLVHSLDGLGTGKSTELLDHVVGTRSRVVSEPDSEVLNLKRLLLVDDVEGNDLTVSLLGLLQLTKVVPVSGLGDDLVGGKDPHAVELGSRVRLGREGSAHNRVLGETSHSTTQLSVRDSYPIFPASGPSNSTHADLFH